MIRVSTWGSSVVSPLMSARACSISLLVVSLMTNSSRVMSVIAKYAVSDAVARTGPCCGVLAWEGCATVKASTPTAATPAALVKTFRMRGFFPFRVVAPIATDYREYSISYLL